MLFVVAAQVEAQAPNPSPVQLEAVEVTGRRGAARLPPERELGPDEIDNLGAYDIGEVIARLSESLALQQPPVVIVNGRRVVDPGAFTRFPPDALVRVEMLPAQAGAMYGGDPSRRVVNIVLQPAFKSRDAQARYSRPTAGGTSSSAADVRQSQIRDNQSFQAGVQASRTTALRSDERPTGDLSASGAGYSLRPETETTALNASMTGALGEWATSFTANAQRQQEGFTSRSIGPPVQTRQRTDTLTLGGGLGGRILGWSLRAGMDGVIAEGRQKGLAALTSRTRIMSATLSADRSLIDLPAGPALLTADARYVSSNAQTRSAMTDDSQSFRSLDLRSNLSLPILSAASGGSDGWKGPGGDLSVNLGGRLSALNDAGSNGGLNAGVAWAPVSKLRVSWQWAEATDAPTREQRFDPPRYGPPRTVYDFQSQQAVEIAPLLGGNPDLKAQTTRTATLTASAGPFGPWGVQTNLDLQTTRATNAIGALPALTPAVEAVFPDRFARDADGRLIGVDQRPINLTALSATTLSSGLSANIPLGGDAAAAARRGSMQITMAHTWRLEDSVIIRDGLPQLDLLAGDGGAAARHQLTARVDARYGRWGLNAALNWRGPSRLRRDLGVDGPMDLRLSSLTTVGVKASTTLARTATPSATERRRTEGLRLEVEIENLFDARPMATLGDGSPAPGYGRNDQDPLGRTVRMTLSRRF
ncbi:TonB-dependent receptor [Brevundimonas sp.]|jgi:hypothetical protein|uniref:TonB-dependent receptor n=2 Tax=Brevundimonas sp. TaxID=1871086 RepID=UPI003B00B2BD